MRRYALYRVPVLVVYEMSFPPNLRAEGTHQEAGGVVQQAAEAAHEAPLQEGRVLRGQLLGAVHHHAAAALQA